VYPGARAADPLIQLHIDAGVSIRVTIPLAAARRLQADLDRAIAFHDGPAPR
jgi:hypothetical protein